MTVSLISKTLSYSLNLIDSKTLKTAHLRDKKIGLLALTMLAGLLVLSYYLIKKCFFSAKVKREKYNKQELIEQILKGNNDALLRAADDLIDENGKIDDLDVMKVAVQQPKNGWTLVYASPRLCNQDELVKLAVANDTTSRALLASAPRFHDNRLLVKQTLTQCPCALVWLFQYQNDLEMVRIAIENEKGVSEPDSIKEYNEETSPDIERRCIFVNASREIRANRKRVKFAIQKNRRAYFFILDRLKTDPEIVAVARKQAIRCQDQAVLAHIKKWNPSVN